MTNSKETSQEGQANWETADPNLDALLAANKLLVTDVVGARIELENLAEHGSVLAMLSLATSFLQTRPVNLVQAERWFREARSRGALAAFGGLGRCYYTRGEIIAAKEVFTEGTDRGDAVSMEWLAHFKLAAEPQEFTYAIELLKKSAAKGQVRAKMRLAHLQMQGRLGLLMIPVGVAQFISAMFQAFQIAARDPNSRPLQ